MSRSNRFHRPALTGTLTLLIALLLLASPISPLLLAEEERGQSNSAELDGGQPNAAQLWSGWEDLGTPTNVDKIKYPDVGQNQDGRLEVFVSNEFSTPVAANVFHLTQTAPNGSWGTWSLLGSSAGGRTAASAVSNTDGRLEVFAQGVWYPGPHVEATHIFQAAPNGAWGNWFAIGQPNPGSLVDIWQPYPGRNKDGRLAILAGGQAPDTNIWLTQQTGAGVNTWTNWINLGKPSGVTVSPVLSVGWEKDGRLDVFTVGSDNAIYHIMQSVPNGSFGSWVGLGKPPGVGLSQPFVYRNEDGRQQVYASGFDGNIYHKYQLAPNGSWVLLWGNLGHPTGVELFDPIAGHLPNGEQCIFAEGDDENVWARWQTCPNCDWGSWQNLGKPATTDPTSQLATGNSADGNPVLFLVGEDGHLWVNPWRTWVPPVFKTMVYLPMIIR